jgi:hypothetical protein
VGSFSLLLSFGEAKESKSAYLIQKKSLLRYDNQTIVKALLQFVEETRVVCFIKKNIHKHSASV